MHLFGDQLKTVTVSCTFPATHLHETGAAFSRSEAAVGWLRDVALHVVDWVVVETNVDHSDVKVVLTDNPLGVQYVWRVIPSKVVEVEKATRGAWTRLTSKES